MIKHGPIDVIVLASGEPRLEGGVFAELKRQAAAGTIRVLDAMLLMKDDKGKGWRFDLESGPNAACFDSSTAPGRCDHTARAPRRA